MTIPFLLRSMRELYGIRWDSNGQHKWVKRLNLLLVEEDRAAFRFRLRQAHRRRDEVGLSPTVQ